MRVCVCVCACVCTSIVCATPLLGIPHQSQVVQCLVATVLGARAAEWFLCQLRKRRMESGRTAALRHCVVSLCCWELSGVGMGGGQVH